MTELLFVAPNFPPKRGGVERLLDGLARHTAPQQTVVLAPPHADAAATDVVAPYEIRRAPLVARRPPKWLTARRLLRRTPASVVVCGEWWPAARALSTLPRRGRRVVIVHGTDVARALRSPRTRRALLRSLRACDTVVAVTRFTAGLLAPFGIEAVILNPGVELDPPAAPAEALDALGLTGHPIVLTTARLVPREGPRPVLAAWPLVRDACPGAGWVVAGDGPERPSLEAEATDGVRILGAVDDDLLTALYRAAAVHVLPGLVVDGDVEGFGMAAIEAGAAGTPTVATDVGGTAEAVGDGGVIVADAREAALTVAALLLDDARRHQLGVAARQRAEELAWPAVGSRFRQIVGLP
jgi:phosphatidylinositol alpha-1,6-mannosyltransferase